jgi:hypothetical protein
MANETLESELAEALRARLAVIGDAELRRNDPEGQLAQLKEVSERIGALQGKLPVNVHPQLRHFFERCSYDKALEWIEREGLGGASGAT